MEKKTVDKPITPNKDGANKKEKAKIKKGSVITGFMAEVLNFYLNGPWKIRANQSASYAAAKYGEENVLAKNFKMTLADYANVHRLFTNEEIKRRIEVDVNRTTSPVAIKKLLEDELTASDAKPADRIRAKELLGKTHAMFVDKQETDHKFEAIFDTSPDDEDPETL